MDNVKAKLSFGSHNSHRYTMVLIRHTPECQNAIACFVLVVMRCENAFQACGRPEIICERGRFM